MKTSLVVLTFNEKEGMSRIMPQVDRSWVDEIVVVDGNSKDGTIELAKQMGLRVVVQEKRGRGEAFRVGLQHTTGDAILYFSPDGNEDPQDIPKLIKKMKEGYDMVIASRFSKESKSEDATLIRRIGNNFFTAMINVLFRTKVTDAVNGYRIIKRKVMQDLHTTAQFFDIEIQMTMRCAKKGYRVAEIPTLEPKRLHGEGKLNTVVDGWRYLRLIIKEWIFW